MQIFTLGYQCLSDINNLQTLGPSFLSPHSLSPNEDLLGERRQSGNRCGLDRGQVGAQETGTGVLGPGVLGSQGSSWSLRPDTEHSPPGCLHQGARHTQPPPVPQIQRPPAKLAALAPSRLTSSRPASPTGHATHLSPSRGRTPPLTQLMLVPGAH